MSDIFWRHRHLLRVGDMVRVRVDPVFPELERNYTIGEPGEIVGFAIKSVCRTATFLRQRAGIYLEPEWPFVRFGPAVVRNIRANSLELIDESEYNWRLERSISAVPHTISLRSAFVSELPDTKIWEGDIVFPKYIPKQLKHGSVPGLPGTYMVNWMYFHSPGEIIESLNHGPYFSIGDRFLRNSEDGWCDSQLELVERGNFWRRAHGEPLVFRDLEEESFWAWLFGEVEYIPAPQPPRETWERECLSDLAPEVQKEEAEKWRDEVAALACIHKGAGHGLQTHRFPDPDYDNYYSVRYSVIRFKNEELGRRVKEATLNGFRVPSRYWVNDKK